MMSSCKRADGKSIMNQQVQPKYRMGMTHPKVTKTGNGGD